jgi:hypothetical protein
VRKGQRVWLAVLVVAVCVAAVLVVTAPQGGPKRYESDRFTFSYPSEWDRVDDLRFPMAEGWVGERQVGRNVVGIDRDSFVNVYAVDAPGRLVDRANVRDLILTERQTLVEMALELGTVQIRQEPFVVEGARLPAIRFVLLYDNPRGVEVTSTITQLYEGTTQYIVACEADSDGRAEIERGCRMVLDTLEARSSAGAGP